MSLLRTLALPLLFLAAAASAQQVACPPEAPDLRQLRPDELRGTARDRGVLWRLQKEGRTSWLYGTVHVNRLEWSVPGPRVVRALAAADVLALELDPTDPELARVLMARGDAARERRVLAGQHARIAQLADRACLPAERLAPLRPLLQLMTLIMAEARREGLHAELGVDFMLFGMARQAGKEIVALESPAAQLAAMVPDSEADERTLIDRGLADLETGEDRELLGQLMQAWADGDEARIANYPEWCKCLETPAEQRLFRRLNDYRNGAMADKLAALHAGGQSFFAGVGALHMTGPQALPTLLRQRGFTVQRISFTSPDTP